MDAVKPPLRGIADVESRLIRQVRLSDNLSRVELARRLRLAPSTVGLYVDRLVSEGFLREERKAARTTGRPPTILELAPTAGEFIGVDFEASQIAVTAVDFSQRVMQQQVSQIPASDSADRVIDRIESSVAAIERRHRLLGIGVGVPGVVDLRRGMAVHYTHIRGWQNIPLAQRLSDRFGVPVHLENNIRAMALAERWFGLAREVSNFVCLGLRSGIGAGLMMNGQLYSGHDGLAGEIGGWPCEMGRSSEHSAKDAVVPLERVASVRSILDRLTDAVRSGQRTILKLKRNRVVLEELLRAANEADRFVLNVLCQAAEAVGKVIAQLSLLLNPELIILAGPLAALTDAFLRPLVDTVERLSPLPHARAPKIVASQFGMYGGAIGAAALAVHQWQPSR